MAAAAAAGAGGLRITQVAGDNTHFGTPRLRASMPHCARQASMDGDASWPNSLPRRLAADLQSDRLRPLAARGGKLVGFRIFNLTPGELVYVYESDRDVQTRQIPDELWKRLPGLDTSPFACPESGVGVMANPGETVIIEAAGRRTEYHVDHQQCQHIFVHLERLAVPPVPPVAPLVAVTDGDCYLAMKVRAPQICALCTQAVHDKLLAHDALQWGDATHFEPQLKYTLKDGLLKWSEYSTTTGVSRPKAIQTWKTYGFASAQSVLFVGLARNIRVLNVQEARSRLLY
eukprot:COSAG01_NODE_400_length_17542_cov_19.747005_4_plen_288_part_00